MDCSSGGAEYENGQSFEYHFYPEEYDTDYGVVNKTLSLQSDKDYQIKIDASCSAGSMEISVLYKDGDILYVVNSNEPCNETIAIAAHTTDEVTFNILIEADTAGSVVVDTLFHK